MSGELSELTSVPPGLKPQRARNVLYVNTIRGDSVQVPSDQTTLLSKLSSAKKTIRLATFARSPVEPEIQLGFVHFYYKHRSEISRQCIKHNYHMSPISCIPAAAAGSAVGSAAGEATSTPPANMFLKEQNTFGAEVAECIGVLCVDCNNTGARSSVKKGGLLHDPTTEYRTMDLAESIGGDLVTLDDISAADSAEPQEPVYDYVVGKALVELNPDILGLMEILTHHLLIENIVRGMRSLKRGGSLILPCYDMYTTITWKIVSLLGYAFSEIKVVRSQATTCLSGRRYLCASGYGGRGDGGGRGGGSVAASVVLEIFQRIDSDIRKNTSAHGGGFLCTLLDQITIDHMLPIICDTNNRIMCATYRSMNRLSAFLQKGDFFGAEFVRFQEERKEDSERWAGLREK